MIDTSHGVSGVCYMNTRPKRAVTYRQSHELNSRLVPLGRSTINFSW